MSPIRISGVILAGGQSSRMGVDKAFLELDGKFLLERQLRLLADGDIFERWISGRPGADYSRWKEPVLLDGFPERGPLEGIRVALKKMTGTHLLVLAVDLPEMSGAVIRGLLAAVLPGAGAVFRQEGRWEPLVGVYPAKSLPVLEDRLERGELSAQGWIRQLEQEGLVRALEVPASWRAAFENWNEDPRRSWRAG